MYIMYCLKVHKQLEDDAGETEKHVMGQGYVPDANSSNSRVSVPAPKGVVFMEGSAAEAHGRWHFLHRQTRPCPTLTPYVPTAPPGPFKAPMVLEQVK